MRNCTVEVEKHDHKVQHDFVAFAAVGQYEYREEANERARREEENERARGAREFSSII